MYNTFTVHTNIIQIVEYNTDQKIIITTSFGLAAKYILLTSLSGTRSAWHEGTTDFP